MCLGRRVRQAAERDKGHWRRRRHQGPFAELSYGILSSGVWQSCAVAEIEEACGGGGISGRCSIDPVCGMLRLCI